MDQAKFLTAATFIAKRNISDAVTRVIARFDENSGHMTVIYCFNSAISEDDREWCELTCGELVAELPKIVTAETKCLESKEECALEERKGGVVFSRDT
jgi:hypothetical protein